VGGRPRDEDGTGRSQIENGTDLRRRPAGIGGSVCHVRRMRVHNRRQVHHASVRPILPRAVPQVRDVRAEARQVVFRVERETVLPSGLRQVSSNSSSSSIKR